MSDREMLSSSLSESICTSLCFSNDDYGNLIAARVEPSYFELPYLDIVTRALEYRQRYKEAPGEAHVDDLFDAILSGTNVRLAETYHRLLVGMLEQYKGLNTAYISTRVNEFVRRQKLKVGVLKAAERYTSGGDNIADEVEQILLDTISQKVEIEDAGSFLSDKAKFLAAFENDDTPYCKTGIKELDIRHVCPTKKELFMFVAARGRGKSWLLVHLGKYALMQNWKVAHISLEMGEKILIKRYAQTHLAATKRNSPYVLNHIETSEHGQFYDNPKAVDPEFHFEDPHLLRRLAAEHDKLQNRFSNLVIKEFPSGSLTVPKLEAYLDSLEITHRFIPDMVLLDYPDLMQIDIKNPVNSLGRLIVDLRGLAGRRNLAVVAPTQANREGEVADKVQTHHIAGDISKAATADQVLTYSQSDFERERGLARLFVNKSRNEEDHFSIVITQSYATGQFCLSSMMLPSGYMKTLKEMDPKQSSN